MRHLALGFLLVLIVFLAILCSMMATCWHRVTERPRPSPLKTVAWKGGEAGIYDYGGSLSSGDLAVERTGKDGEVVRLWHLGYAWDYSLERTPTDGLTVRYKTMSDGKTIVREMSLKSVEEARRR